MHHNLAVDFADELRKAGNALVASEDYEGALEKYTAALHAFGAFGFEQGLAVCLTNRAVVCGKLNRWAESYCDARTATRCSPKYAKAWFRCGVALEKLGMARAAGTSYYRAVEEDQTLYAQATPALQRCRTTKLPLPVLGTAPQGDAALTVSEFFFVIGPGRCGLHSCAAMLSQYCRVQCLSRPDFRVLLWDPNEPRAHVIARKLDKLSKNGCRGDVNYAWLPYASEILRLLPAAKFVVLLRDIDHVVESWFHWTEAGSLRETPEWASPMHLHGKNHWQWHDQSRFDFDEWDLTLPKYQAPTKRDAIRLYVESYYDECRALAADFPANFKFVPCDALDARDLVSFLLGRDASSSTVVFHENKQRYMYDGDEQDDEFFEGDFVESVVLDDEPLAITDEAAGATVVVVPPGARAGDTLRFTVRGRSVEVRVPQGKVPGDSFELPAD